MSADERIMPFHEFQPSEASGHRRAGINARVLDVGPVCARCGITANRAIHSEQAAAAAGLPFEEASSGHE